MTKIKAPLLAQHGDKDAMKGFSDPEAFKSLAEKMESAGNPVEMYSYHSAGHGFMNILTSVGTEMLASGCEGRGAPLFNAS